MKSANTGLTFKQFVVVFLLLFTWVICFLTVLSLTQQTSGTYPALWVFSTSILLLLWLTHRRTNLWQQALGLYPVGFIWLSCGLILGLLYWQIDQWMMTQLFKVNVQNDIQMWQQTTASFFPISLLVSSVVMAPLFEELVFRGLILNALQQKTNGLIAIILSSLLFAAIHWSWPEFLSLFVIGMIYALMTLKSNSIVPALLAHITHNALTFWLYAAV